MSKASELLSLLLEYNEKDLLEPFDLDDFENFSKQHKKHKLENQVTISGDECRLLPKIAKDLARTYKVFTDGKVAEKRVKAVERGLLDQAKEAMKDCANELGVSIPKARYNVKVSLDYDSYKSPAIVTVSVGGETLTLEWGINSQNYANEVLPSDISEWSWCAWFADDESPLYDSTFVDAYLEDRFSQVLEELADLDSDAMLDDKVKNFIKTLQ